MNDVVAYRQELARTEFLSPDELERHCVVLLARICEFARRNVPYYRKRLAPLFETGPFDSSRWSEVPILDRPIVIAKRAELQARNIPDFAGPSTESWTSGSTGTPLRYLRSRIDFVASRALTNRALSWWDLDGSRDLATIQMIKSDSNLLSDEGAGGWLMGGSGRNFGIPITDPVDVQLAKVKDLNVDYIFTRPAMAEILAEEALRTDAGIRLSTVLTVGGPVSQSCRDLCREAFGAPILDLYGSRECGNLAAQCPQCGVMHVSAEACLLEVLRPDGTPCEPGEVGRVHVTSFFNFAMPLIRYDLCDYAEVGPAHNVCGRGLPSLTRVLGRDTEAFRRRDGSRFFPTTEARTLKNYMPFKQVQFVQTDYETVEIRYVPANDGSPVDHAGVSAYIKEKLGPAFETRLVPVDEIARGNAAKYSYQVCEIGQQT